jgi:hypothetical protein
MGRSLRRTLAAALVLLGAVLVLMAFTTLDWYGEQYWNGPGGTSFADLRQLAQEASYAPGIFSAYVGWLGWLLLVVCVALSVASIVHSDARLRGAALVVALSGAVLTFVAMFELYDPSNEQTATVFTTASAGIFAAIGGFVAMAAAGLVVP